MDNKKRLTGIINGNEIISDGKEYAYPNIPEKISDKIKKYFDPYINPEDIVIFIDSTLAKSSKGGLVFTLSGVYFKSILEKTYYVNYRDISDVTVIPDKKGNTETNAKLEIKLSDGAEVYISSLDFNKSILKDVLLKCKKEAKKQKNIIYSIRPSGEVKALKLSAKEKKKCHIYIHTASAAAAGIGAGLAQIPASDSAALMVIQTGMITSIASVFEIRLTEGAAKGIVSGMAASFTGRAVSQFLIGWIPVLGNAVNATTAAGITESIGWAAAAHFFYIHKQCTEDFNAGIIKTAKIFEKKYIKLWEMMK